jgi:phospholipid/cholesterol/gamma-HCH transport system substrate-binding protein
VKAKKLIIGPATERVRNIIIGILSLCLFFGGTAVGVQWAFGAFNSEYQISGLFSSAGQGLLPGADVKIRGVNIGEVEGVKLEDLQARVTLAIDTGQQIPRDSKATIRPKTLFGEKFIDIEPGKREGNGPYLKDGDELKETLGGFELERVLSELYPILKAVDPAELAVVLGGLADAGDGLGEEINRSIVNFQKISEVNAAHAADTQQFLTDFARLADELALRAPDLVTGAELLNETLPELNAHGDDLSTVLDQAARLSRDLSDVLDANRGFMRKSITEGGKTLQLLYDERQQIRPLVNGLRQYLQLLSEAVRIPLGDGTYLAAVKGIMGGGDPCGQGLGESCFTPEGSPGPPPPPEGSSDEPAPPAPPGVVLPPIELPELPPLPVPSTGAQAVTDLLGGLLQ